MKTLTLCLLLAAIVGCGAETSTQQSRNVSTPGQLVDIPDVPAYALGAPVSYGRLSIVPVLAKDKQDLKGDYATLAEAKKNGWVEIVERPGYGEVNRLLVRNGGPKDLLLLGGELLVGGKQDRIVAHDTIVPVGKETEVDVYCVEHGRWQGETKFEYGQTMVPDSVRESATYEDQAQVWSKVEQYRESAGVPAESGTTIRGGLEQKRIAQKVDDGLDEMRKSLDKTENVVGFVVAFDGRAQTLELFGSSTLFAAARDPLLKSYLAEAALGSPASTPQVSISQCASFVSEVLNSRRRLRSDENGAQVFDLAPSDGAEPARGRELADKSYEAKPSAKSRGLIHGTYKRGQ